MRSSMRLLLQLSAPRQLLQRPVPSARVLSAAATGDGTSAPSDARPERRTGRTAEEQMTAAIVAALTDPRVLRLAGEVALLRAEVAATQSAARVLEGRVREAVEAAAAARTQAAGSREELAAMKAQLVSASPGVDLARQKATIPAAAERGDLCARGTKTQEEKLLLAAAEKGNLPEVERLLSDPATNPNVHGQDGWTALRWASMKGHTEVVAALLRAGANKEARDGAHGQTALHLASEKGRTEVVAALLRAGADMEAKNLLGWTALHEASLYGRTEVVAALLQAGADKEAKNRWDQQTALHIASCSGHTGVVAALLRAGVNKKAKDGNGDTPLAIAKRWDWAEVVALLEGWRSK